MEHRAPSAAKENMYSFVQHDGICVASRHATVQDDEHGTMWYDRANYFGSTVHCSVMRHRVVRYGTVRFGTIINGAFLFDMLRYGLVRYCTIWFGVVRYQV